MFFSVYVCIYCLLSELLYLSRGDMVAMKIVEGPSNNNAWNVAQHGVEDNLASHELVPRITPANFSGPSVFSYLLGKCFSSNISSYEYSFCPFNNVTQKEHMNTWMPYHGILGIWREWTISNYTFTGQLYEYGDECGDLTRSVNVVFECGDREEILNVTEPSRCTYRLTFMTRVVCHPYIMLVYPSLNREHRLVWDEIETLWKDKQLTDLGYTKELHHLFEEAGYIMSDVEHKTLVETSKSHSDSFTSLHQCKQEYKKLENEHKQFQEQIALLNSSRQQT